MWESAPVGLERTLIVGNVWKSCCERFDVTDFYVNSFYALVISFLTP
jgi:hypothetical protein